MTGSMVAAMILSDRIEGKKSPFAQVFSPQRFEPAASAGEFVKMGVKSAKGLLRGLLAIPEASLEDIPRGRGVIIGYEKKDWGVYKKEDGDVHVVPARCPHMGCQLTWNADEDSWDCPCHGSRFDYRGRLLNNPALEDLVPKEGE